jgi:GH24 family phage-related lysozyme (muramidase)
MTPAQKRASALTLAAAIAIPAEGLRQMAYKDPVGIPTICFGTTRGVKLGDYKSVPECKALLTSDMQAAVDTVDRCVNTPLNVNQLAAFSDLVYNVGPTPVCDTSKSTMARKLRAGDVIGACRELLKWDKARAAGVLVALPGLTKRRTVEMDLCLKDMT